MPTKENHVRVPNPRGDGVLRALVVGRVDPDDAFEADALWVTYEEGDLEGATGQVRHGDIRPA